MRGISVIRPVILSAIVATAAGLSIAAPTSADAAVRPDLGPQAGVIEGIGGVNMRSGPGTNYAVVGLAANQQSVTVYCWNPGTVVNGDQYWDWLYDPANHVMAFVADAYVYTKGNIVDQVVPCIT